MACGIDAVSASIQSAEVAARGQVRGKDGRFHWRLRCVQFLSHRDLGAFGDGEAVVTSRAAVAEQLRLLQQ